MEIYWALIITLVIYGFFLARYFYFFHKVLPKKYGLFTKNLISHAVLLAVVILMFIFLKNQ